MTMPLQILDVKKNLLANVNRYFQTVFHNIFFDNDMKGRAYIMNNVTSLLERPCKIKNSIPDEGRGFY